jgi:tRNA 2-thiouridine synthesizing protein E
MTFSNIVNDIIDDQGFVTDPDIWDRDLALAMAAELDIGELTETHWRVIDELRAHYLEHGSLPWMRHICRTLEVEDDCIYHLFHGPVEAWKIAGLPNPGYEARIYMENEEPD